MLVSLIVTEAVGVEFVASTLTCGVRVDVAVAVVEPLVVEPLVNEPTSISLPLATETGTPFVFGESFFKLSSFAMLTVI